MEQFMSAQIGNWRGDMRVLPMESQQGKAFFTFTKTATLESPSEMISFRHDQASFLEDPLLAFFHMLSRIWGRIDDLISFVNLQKSVSGFCHQVIQQRNVLDVRFYIYIFWQTAGILRQQPSINPNIRGEMIDGVSEQGLDQTVIAKLERVDAAGVLEHDDRCSICSICFEAFSSNTTCFITAAFFSG